MLLHDARMLLQPMCSRDFAVRSHFEPKLEDARTMSATENVNEANH